MEEVKEAVAPLTKRQRLALGRCYKAFKDLGTYEELLRRMANSIVNLRLTFQYNERPDYAGVSWAYREAARKFYEDVLPDADRRRRFKDNVRHYISDELRARVDAGEIQTDELLDAGITKAVREPEAKKTDLEKIEDLIEKNVENLGAVFALRAVERELGSAVASLRTELQGKKQPPKTVVKQVHNVLDLALDAAYAAGIDLQDYVQEYVSEKIPVGAF